MKANQEQSEIIEFSGFENNRLVASIYGNEGPCVLFLHGGGQTRHAWGTTAMHVAEQGFRSIVLDMRGHGESDWVASKNYTFGAYSNDLQEVCLQIIHKFGKEPISIGASLGGISSLLAQYESKQAAMSGLVLVDIVPDMDMGGVHKIQQFMSSQMNEGFETLDEAANTIARYLPNRTRPKNLDGLAKNLRLGDDGRYRWHWDPGFMSGPLSITSDSLNGVERLSVAARALSVPTLLVRGRQSELVSAEAAKAFCEMVPHAGFVDVEDAGHMIAGDKNDIFSQAVCQFLQEQTV